MTSTFRSAIAIVAMIAGLLSSAEASGQPAVAQADKGVQDSRAARILRTFQTGRKILIQTTASEAVMKDFDRAEQTFAAGDIDGALGAIEESLKREAPRTTFRVIWSAYDRIVEDYDKLDRGVAFMQKLVTLYPNVPDVRAALASAYGVKSSKLSKVQPLDPATLKDVIRYANLSIEQLDVALAIDPESFMARLGRAISLSYTPSKLTAAEEDFDKLLSLQTLRKNPWYPYSIVYYFYADALKRSDRLTRAGEVLAIGLHYYPANEDLRKLLGEVNKINASR